MKAAEVVVRCLSIARTRCGRDEFYTLRRPVSHPFSFSWYFNGGAQPVGHETARDPRGHNETRSTQTENGTELTMSTNLQLSLQQLAPIECKRRPLVGGPVPPFLLLLFSPPFYFLELGSSPVETFMPRARDCCEWIVRPSDEFPLSLRGSNERNISEFAQ